MAKKREEREDRKKKATGGPCDLDAGFASPGLSIGNLSLESVSTLLARSRYVQCLLAITVIGCLLRFYNLGFNSFWLDEASTYTFATMSIPEVWQATTAGEFNPPLFYWIEHFMLTFGNNEAVLRFVPALAGVLTIPLVYLIGREFMDRNVGIIAAAACAFSPFLIFYSQEARAYSMALFFVAFATFFLLRALKTDTFPDWVLFGIMSALAFWSHFYALVMIGALGLYALFVKLPAIQKDLIGALKPVVVAGVAFVICSLPLVFVTLQLFTKRTSGGASFGIQGIGIVVETFRQLSGFSTEVMCLFLILFVIGIVQAFLIDRNKGIFLVALTFIPFVISGFLSYSIPMVPRYLITLAPVYFVGIALAYLPVYRLINNRGVVYGLIAAIVLLSVTTPFFMSYYTQYTKEDWRGFSGQVQQVTVPGDFIVVVPGYVLQPLNYYYSNATDRTFEFGAYTAADLDAIAAQKTNATTLYYVVTADISSADPSGDAITWLQGHATQAGQNSGIYLFKSV